MSKYDPLSHFLRVGTGEAITLSFEQVGMLVGGLPASAREYHAWWANGDVSHQHCRSWGNAGFTAHPDLDRESVEFRPG